MTHDALTPKSAAMPADANSTMTIPTAESLPAEEQNRLAEILDAYLVAIEQGAPITPAELLAQHPAEAEYLRLYLSGLELFHAAAAPGRTAITAAEASLGGPPAGQMIGEFAIVREIGRGGMGVVYEAVQPALRRRVALKVLPRSAANDAKQLGRFKNEAQAAAQVQHPNIVPVFAVGEDAGVHYFAMQLIEGASLATVIGAAATPAGHLPGDATTIRFESRTWADARTIVSSSDAASIARSGAASAESPYLPTAAMVFHMAADRAAAVARLGVQAADALHAAHEFGVIHRDVKPSNLLVDAHGKLWVADFGLARFRDGADLTQTGDVCGTMRYMSPEQALGRAALVDHRTDVYSLGVTMYEVATLHHPAEGVGDLRRIFDAGGFVSKPLRHWDRLIPVDFETIVMKATAELPSDRYDTAQELADDLRRFLAGEPIRAVPPTRLTRVAKWAKRHKRAVAAAACVLVCGLGTLIGSASYVAGAKANADQAAAAALSTSQDMGRLIYDVPLSTAEQLAAIPGTENVRRQLLEQSLDYYRRLTKQAYGDPALGANLALAYSKIGGLNAMIGDREKALAAHRDARRLLEGLVAQNPDNFEYARNLALCRNNAGMVLADMGRPADAIAEFTAAREQFESLRAGQPQDAGHDAKFTADLATTYGNLGLASRDAGDAKEAARWFHAAIALAKEVLPAAPDDEKLLRSVAASDNNLGSLEEATDAAAAADAYEHAVELQRRLVARRPLNQLYQGELARSLNNLGYANSLRKAWPAAQQAYAEAIGLQSKLVESAPQAAVHHGDLAVTYNNLGMALSQIGRLDEAAKVFELALKQERMLLGARPDDAAALSNMGGMYNNLGMLWQRRERPVDAAEAYLRAIEFQKQALDAQPNDAAKRELLSKHYFNYARCLRDQGELASATDVVLARRALWSGNADRLLAVARELAEIYRRLPATSSGDGAVSSSAQLRGKILAAGGETLREAVAAGLPAERLHDPALAAFGNDNLLTQQPTT